MPKSGIEPLHKDFQSNALPIELSKQDNKIKYIKKLIKTNYALYLKYRNRTYLNLL